MRRATLDALLDARAAGRSIGLVTDVKTGLQSIVTEGTIGGDLTLGAEPSAAAIRGVQQDLSGRIADELFLHVFATPQRLVLVGAVHIAQALAPMATLAGYAVTIVDPRGAFGTEARFPGVALDGRWPDEALEALRPDRRTAIVTLTHDPKLDDPALAAALRSECFYIGALGSKKTHATRRERLAAAGFDAASFARIHGPIGLAIGAESPAEIAVAILAEITQVRRLPATRGATETAA